MSETSIDNSNYRKERLLRKIHDGIAEAVAEFEGAADGDITDVEIVASLGEITRYFTSKMLREQHTRQRQGEIPNGTSSNQGAGEEVDAPLDGPGEDNGPRRHYLG